MDVNIILLAVLLFIPVYLMGIVSNNRIFTLILAGILVMLVMLFAGEKYMFFDVMGIGGAIYFAFMEIND